MKKIPTLFVRDYEARPAYVTPEVTPGCEWVLAGEGVATVKWDGTCTMLDELGSWWARREVKPGKPVPVNFLEVDHDEVTGKRVGWEPMAQSSWVKAHAEAVTGVLATFGPGTYELVGPKVNGNPEGFPSHILIRHGYSPHSPERDTQHAPREYRALRLWLHDRANEGIVWHHPDGRMAKIKTRDFPTPPIDDEEN